MVLMPSSTSVVSFMRASVQHTISRLMAARRLLMKLPAGTRITVTPTPASAGAQLMMFTSSSMVTVTCAWLMDVASVRSSTSACLMSACCQQSCWVGLSAHPAYTSTPREPSAVVRQQQWHLAVPCPPSLHPACTLQPDRTGGASRSTEPCRESNMVSCMRLAACWRLLSHVRCIMLPQHMALQGACDCMPRTRH